MKVHFLGTASCYPTAHRAVSCTAVKFEDGDVWLFDCGEGSQVQVQKSTIRPSRISKIFITHLHGDHLFGLPGLICTMGQIADRREFSLEIYGPTGLRRYVRETLNLSRSPLPFSYSVHELVPNLKAFKYHWDNWPITEYADGPQHPQETIGRTIVAENGVWTLIEGPIRVQAGQVRHRIPSFGFVITEPERPGKLNPVRLKELGVPPGPLYAQIKKGDSITAPSGRVIHHSEVLGPPTRGRRLTIVGDSSDSSGLNDIARGSDMIIHEATLENSMQEKAVDNGHSTPSMAADFAITVEAKCLALYHFSQRYKSSEEEDNSEEESKVKILLEEVQSALECSPCKGMIAEDLLEVDVPRPGKEEN